MSQTVNFTNGYYDLVNMVFKPYTAIAMQRLVASHTDTIPKYTTGYDYVLNSKNEHFEEYMNELFPNNKIREYVLHYLASLFEKNNNNHFAIFYGSGNNGKTVFARLLKETFGDSLKFLNLDDYENDTSEIYCVNNFDIVENVSIIKDLVSKKHLFVETNDIDAVKNSYDSGLKKRVVLIPFNATFTNGDKQMYQKVKSFKETLMWQLLNVYYPLKDIKFDIPKEMTL
jgi:phage/plasmid-associated DNA primase